MKLSHIRSGLLAVTFTLVLLIANEAVSETTTQGQAGSAPHPVSVEASHPLAMAHKKLEQAYNDYKKGDMDAVQNDLDDAGRWLKDSKMSGNTKTRDEAAKLAAEIQSLRQNIQYPSEEHEGAIARIWHRASALVTHEVQHLERSWSVASTANKTMKQLLNAKLHLNYAEHELFVSHDEKRADKEIKKTVSYLDHAYDVASPRVRVRLTAIKSDLQKLTNSSVNTDEQQKIIDALDTASTSLKGVSQAVTPRIEARLNTIATEIENLKKKIGMLERQQQYDTILERIRKLNSEL